MPRTAAQLREDVLRIWLAGVTAVRSPRLIFDTVEVADGDLRLGDEWVRLDGIRRIAVVGGGKAAAGMTQALEQALGPAVLQQKHLHGLVSVPDDCLLPTDAVKLFPGRPAGLNEPTAEGLRGAHQMLRLVAELHPQDLCICLLSGGASALLPAPIEGISLADKLALTREMSARGATIHQMNAVRRELSHIKGGGLARACRASRLVALIISDVPGDDVSLIGSGPTVQISDGVVRAIAALRTLALTDLPAGRRAIKILEDRLDSHPRPPSLDLKTTSHCCQVANVIIGNNSMAVDAAGAEAERLGYSHAMIAANEPEGDAEEVARKLVEMARQMRNDSGPDCLITGGEPTVRLAPATIRGRGGRNQQLCLAALAEERDWRDVALISGGVDGEDGPTDAAGAVVDESVTENANALGLNPRDFLARNDAYSFFTRTGGLLKTGPTHTNVCDLRVITVSR
ncbi:MAG TPA: DUF4147 domain-containing protein [Lacipirellula sp.]